MEHSVSLRRAQAKDAKPIRRLVRQVRINPSGLDWRHFWVAVDAADRVVGGCQIKTHQDGSRELASVAVAEEYRGQGIARRLITQDLAGQVPPIYLTCRESLGPFYARFGFGRVAEKEYPPYFNRIKRIFSLLRRLRIAGEDLLILVWWGD